MTKSEKVRFCDLTIGDYFYREGDPIVRKKIENIKVGKKSVNSLFLNTNRRLYYELYSDEDMVRPAPAEETCRK